MRYRATLAYDGSAYQGFQRQAGDIPTVQRSIEQALVAVTGQEAGVIAAGRTDSGVHATGQVIAFDVTWRHDPDALLRALNVNLPQDIALQSIREHPGFHPRFDAQSRHYEYTLLRSDQRQPLLRNHAWWIPHPLDVEVMQHCAALLIGEHDFATFGPSPQGDNTVRTVFVSEWSQVAESDGNRLCYRIEGNAFLQHMVRRIVGMLVAVGRGMRSAADFESAFRSADIAQAKSMAPPQGLVLVAVTYRD